MSKLKACPACGNEVATSAKMCPHCGKKLKSGFFVKLLYGIIILVVIGMVFGPTAEEKAQKQQVAIDNIKHAEALSISPAGAMAEMFSLMSENTDIQRDNVEKELNGKIIQWRLTVYEVDKNSDGTYRVQTSDINKVGTFIQLHAQNGQEIAVIEGLKTGSTIVVKGKISGIFMRHIEIDPAILMY